MLGRGVWNDSASLGSDQEQSRNWGPEALALILIEGEREPKVSSSMSAAAFVLVMWGERRPLGQVASWLIAKKE
jgi:hypothetical protein